MRIPEHTYIHNHPHKLVVRVITWNRAETSVQVNDSKAQNEAPCVRGGPCKKCLLF